jgi:hypothetical protein
METKMQIQSTRTTTTTAKAIEKAVPASSEGSPSEPQDTVETGGLTAKTFVTKAAFTTGGALGGSGLGVVTGLALSNVSGSAVFGQIGGVVGAVGGAAAGLAASSKGISKENLARSVGSWVGASVASSAGMWAAGTAGAYLAQNGAAALFANNSALLGTAAGGLIGAAIPFIGAEGAGANMLKNTAVVVGGAGVGIMAGGGIQAAVQNMTANGVHSSAATGALEQLQQTLPELGYMLAPVPLLTGAAAALTCLDAKYNGIDSYDPNKKGLRAARNSSYGALIGYGVGSLVGGGVHALTGSTAYMMAAPGTAAAAIGLAVLGAYTKGDDNVYNKLAKTTALTGVGAGIGDAIGHGLTALTGHTVYQNIGAVAGGVNGLVGGLRASGIDDKKGLPLVTGLLTGGTSGALIGAGISALSGQDVWKVAMPVLGAATGVLSGLALSMHAEGSPQSKTAEA